jgi:hypothetical protein
MRLSRLHYKIQLIQDKLYHIVAEYPIHRVSNVNGLKNHLECDAAFKTSNNTYILCELIEEPEWSEIN